MIKIVISIIFILFTVISIVLLSLGISIYKFKTVEIISVYDPSVKYNRDDLAKSAGIHMISMGICTLIESITFLFMCKLVFLAIIPFALIYFFTLVLFSVKVSKDMNKYRL